MEPTSKRSSQGQTIANVIVVPSLVQTAASGPSIGTPKDEEFLNREGRCESKLATADEQRGEIDSYLRDIRHRIEACTGGNRAYYKEAERRWEARQNCYHQSQQRLDRLEHLVRQATNQQIRLTDMYRYREEENKGIQRMLDELQRQNAAQEQAVRILSRTLELPRSAK